MNILLVSPLGFAITPATRYAGIEKLVWLYSRELVKTHSVSVIALSESQFPKGVKVLGVAPPHFFPDLELKAFQEYQSVIRTFDVVHDFSHLHLASRFMDNIPSLNIFWHAPALAQYPKAPYNIIALSQWAAREFRRIYKQEARYQYSIGLDTSIYKLSNRHRNDRFYALGRMGPEKGNFNAASLCKELGLPLDIQGARGLEQDPNSPPTDYEKSVFGLCDGKQIKFLGDLTEPEKVKVMQTNKALLYITDHPEVTSHKLQETLLCGMPAIISGIGAAPEILTHGVNGFLCRNKQEVIKAVKSLAGLEPMKVYDEIKDRFSIETVVKNYIPLYEKVAGGLRW